MSQHHDKHIREALSYAISSGWTVKQSGPRAHAWGIIHCQHGHGDCRMSIWSTPRNPENHAKAIRRKVDRCLGTTHSDS